jgi:predicted nucleic acid-binding protein
MTKPIVSDAGPLITFARARRLDLLRQVTGRVHIPDAVWQEVVVDGRGFRAGALRAHDRRRLARRESR